MQCDTGHDAVEMTLIEAEFSSAAQAESIYMCPACERQVRHWPFGRDGSAEAPGTPLTEVIQDGRIATVDPDQTPGRESGVQSEDALPIRCANDHAPLEMLQLGDEVVGTWFQCPQCLSRRLLTADGILDEASGNDAIEAAEASLEAEEERLEEEKELAKAAREELHRETEERAIAVKRESDAYRATQWKALRWHERRALKMFDRTIARVVNTDTYVTIETKHILGVVALFIVPVLTVGIPVWLVRSALGGGGWFLFFITIPLAGLVFARLKPLWCLRKVVLHRIRRRSIARVGLPPFSED